MRLIDADALPHYDGTALSADEVAMAVINAPTIKADWNEMLVICDNCGHAIHVKRTDVKPIIEPNKGHWVSDEDGNIKCSECGRLGVGDNYCEHCGADMREEKTDE